ncbi:DUF2931 family protein [Mucilaginibacter sp. L196]|uniref:DUF2931 family protein n=1 Tax=Mucilaginibacter sp. L196 TaxID=1641870 RepID=UPI00131E4C2B|nr:DUF2931 family protein [Mucilaginibacter sp. L196]
MRNAFLVCSILLSYFFASCQNKKTIEKFQWLPTECAPELYPMNIAKGFLLFEDGNEISIPSADPIKNGWGKHGSTAIIGDEFKPVPVKLEITWLSYTENKFFSGRFDLPKDSIIKWFKEGYTDPVTLKPATYDCIAVGMAPGGVVVVWIQGINHQLEIGRYQAKESNMTMGEYIAAKGFSSDMTHDRTALCKSTLEDEPAAVENLKVKGLQLGLWDSYRQRFNIRPVMIFDQSHHAKTSSIYMQFYNGEQDDLVLDKLLKNEFSPRARIKKVAFQWMDDWAGKKQKYILELNMDEKEIFNAYKEVYGDNPKQEAELTVQINPGNDHYRIFLKSQTKNTERLKAKGEIYLAQ